jgi:MerR family transcriptional regulator, light-induced transcriptional regulator
MQKFKKFSIAEITALAGMKAHTLRAWERRFGIFRPQRSQGNFRHYDLTELALLLKLRVLNQAGFKISQLARMKEDTLNESLRKLATDTDRQASELSQLIIHLFTLNTDGFEQVLDGSIEQRGISATVSAVILPFLERTQLHSCRNCPIEMDFAVTILRRKIILAIEQARPRTFDRRKALLFLPKGEHYDLLLLYYYYLFKSWGLHVFYMGTNISFEKIQEAIDRKQPHFLVTYLAPGQPRSLEEMMAFAHRYDESIRFFVGTLHLPPKAPSNPSNFRILHYQQLLASLH